VNKGLKVLVTGGSGFVGSNVAEFYAKKGNEVIVFDNLSRSDLLKKDTKHRNYNQNYLDQYKNVLFNNGDITNFGQINEACKEVDVIFHIAAQTAVTASLQDPQTDFRINALGTFNVLEAARKSNNDISIIYCSTNKVYGNNVNAIKVKETETRYRFEERFKDGVNETFPIDLCEHTPYGCSKLAGDLYAQDYAQTYGLKTGIFRMSCIYGSRQFGVEDQGWIAWFAIATVLGIPLTIFGDGKQVRDVLYISDLIQAFDNFLARKDKLKGEVFNLGGGKENSLSLIELLNLLKKLTGKKSKIRYDDWRSSDQKVYVSNIGKAQKKLDWTPIIHPEEGVKILVNWIQTNRNLFD